MNVGFSVVMATYNGARFLPKQLESILGQSLKPDVIVVSDDHSTDGTVDLLKIYQTKSQLSYFENNSSRGVISNFKNAASKVTTESYIAFSDQDDIWLPEKLKTSLERLKSFEDPTLPCMVYSDPVVINDLDQVIAPSLWSLLGFNRYEHRLETVLFGNPAGGCTMLINPALAKYISTIPDDAYMHDAWLTLCAYTFGKAGVMKEQVLQYRQHQSNVTFSDTYKPQKRIQRLLDEIKKATSGKSDLFAEQFIFVKQFYGHFESQMNDDRKRLFEAFLALEDKSYLTKKLAFRKAAKGKI